MTTPLKGHEGCSLAQWDVPNWIALVAEVLIGGGLALLLLHLDRRASNREAKRVKEADERHERLLHSIRDLSVSIKAGLEVSGRGAEGFTVAVGAAAYTRLMAILRMFVSRWESWEKWPGHDKYTRTSRVELQDTAHRLAEESLEVVSLNESFLGRDIAEEVKDVSNSMRQFALAEVEAVGDWEGMERKGSDAYKKANQLIAKLEAETKKGRFV